MTCSFEVLTSGSGRERIFMNYRESRAYIDAAAAYGSVLGLANIQELMKRLGNPEQDLKYVHVGGTNGKGSVIAYVYTTLTGAGYKIGRYISPTLYSYRERIEIDGERISREAFARQISRIAEAIDGMVADGLAHPTPFEIETAAAFLYFQEQKCDLVVMEVGMGGSTDATNIIQNTLVAVLVSISMDHEGFLGNTLAEIAEKKAGIMKKGCHVISTLQKQEVKEVFLTQAECLGVPIRFADYEAARSEQVSLRGQTFSYQGETYEVSLSGICQIENAVVAIEVLRELDQLGFPTTELQKKDGLGRTVWNGRFTVIGEDPLFIVDGAHNPGAADVLEQSIRTYLGDYRIFYIMGMFQDKDYGYVIDRTCSYADKIWTIQTPDNPRAMPSQMLAEEICRRGKDATPMNSIKEAIDAACAEADENTVILAFGSLSFIGALTALVQNKE